ncbi:MAG: hypothetical protein ACRDHW_07470, partial [Ktedonobacteraceae bacterium]
MAPVPVLHAQVLAHFEQMIMLGRHLGKGKKQDMAAARTLSASCLPTITALAQQASPNQKHAANLAAQWYRLHAILGYHTENLIVAEKYAT